MLLTLALLGAAAQPISIFNGRDLTGWVVVNGGPNTWSVKDGELACTGQPAGMLRTDRVYENFVLELDWMHTQPDGNSGIFIWSDPFPAKGQAYPRSVEVQVMLTPDVKDDKGRLLYTGQGDLFSIHGAHCTPDRPHPAGWERCLPDGRFTKGANEWNHYRIEAKDGSIKLSVNGHEVSGVHDVTPRRGYICLESEGSLVRFKNITVEKLPDTVPSLTPEQSAIQSEGWKTLFNGVDLAGWKENDSAKGHWSVNDGVLHYDGKGDHLWGQVPYGDFTLVADWRWTKDHQGRMKRPFLNPDGSEAKNADGTPKEEEVEERDSGIYLRGNDKSQVNIWMWPCGSGEVYGYRTDASMPPQVRAGCTPKLNADSKPGEWNRFEITMKGDHLTVKLNGQLVIENVQLPGVPKEGPLALQSHGCPIEFKNLYLLPLQK